MHLSVCMCSICIWDIICYARRTDGLEYYGSVVCDRECMMYVCAQLLNFWNKVMLWYVHEYMYALLGCTRVVHTYSLPYGTSTRASEYVRLQHFNLARVLEYSGKVMLW